MKLKRKTRRILAAFLAMSLCIPTVLHYMATAYALESCDKSHEWTGLHLYWTDIPTSDGTAFGWPRKTYFTGGTGEWKDMNGMYVYCVANHTGQPGQGAEAMVGNRLTLDKYMEFKWKL